MAEIKDLNVVDDNNTARWPEGQPPDSVNNGARAGEGLEARGFKDTIDTTLISTGSANAYAVVSHRAVPDDPSITGLYDGLTLTWEVNHDPTGACTLAVTMNTTAQPAKPLVLNDGAAITGSEFKSGVMLTTVYKATPDHWKIIAGAVTPVSSDASPKLGGNLDTDGFTVGTTADDKDLPLVAHGTGTVLIDGVGYPKSAGTNGQVLASDGTNFVLQGPLPFSEEYDSGPQVMTAGVILTLNHGLSAQPKILDLQMECVTAQNGWSVGDVMPFPVVQGSAVQSPARGLTARFPSATQVQIIVGSDGEFYGHGVSSFSTAVFTVANWRIRVRAFS